jgi:hypothetical protein
MVSRRPAYDAVERAADARRLIAGDEADGNGQLDFGHNKINRGQFSSDSTGAKEILQRG